MSDPVQKAIETGRSNANIYSDIYNANIFCELWKDKIRWSKDYGGWFIFNGSYWERDGNDRIKHYAMLTHAHMIAQTELLKDKKYFTHLKNSAADNKLNAMLSCSKPHLGARSEDFDRDQHLFNCINGVIDLRSGLKFPHAPQHLITKLANVVFDAEAKCPTWEKFLQDIFLGNQEIIDFMQTAVGYSMTGDVREQCLFILYGVGRNGKSRFLSCINDLLGDYAMNCPSSTFIRKNNQGGGVPNDVARLKGARMVTAVENNQNVSFDESMIKQLTGGTDKLTARFLNKEFFDFMPTFKIFFTTNHKPNIRGTDDGIWRRIKMVPFDFKVTDATDDRQLGEKLRTEMSGILNWALAGCKRWREQGLITPAAIKASTENYKDEEDFIGEFIKDKCAIDKDAYITVKDFKDSIIAHCGFKMSGKTISSYMESKGFKAPDNRKTIDGATIRIYTGLRFTEHYEKQQNLGWDP